MPWSRLNGQGKTRNGISLIDVTVTILVMGIFAAVAIPRFADSMHHYRTETAADKVRADLNYARKLAVARSTDVTVEFDTVADNYTLVGIGHPDRVGQSYVVQLNQNPYQSDLASASFGGGSTIVFDAFGTPDNGGTVTVQAGAYSQTVTVDPDTGKATSP
ncbi:MAG: GspH/FimT family protein [Planctomycetaceae bacterium]|nr:GspH/FimT family protein [Planctomycetaceae bacterium]